MTATTAPLFTTRTVECTACWGAGQQWIQQLTGRVFLDQPCDVCAGAKALTECVECGTNITPDLFHRTLPYAITVRTKTGSYTSRNLSHQVAHEAAATIIAYGDSASIHVDTCG